LYDYKYEGTTYTEIKICLCIDLQTEEAKQNFQEKLYVSENDYAVHSVNYTLDEGEIK
jgi:hypothetical protein